MAVEFKNPIKLTKDSTIYGHQSLDEGGFPKNAGNAKVSQILDLAEKQTIENIQIGGRNLIRGTQTQLGGDMIRSPQPILSDNKYLGVCNICQTNGAWQGASYNFYEIYKRENFKIGDVVTFSIAVMANFTPAKDVGIVLFRIGSTQANINDVSLVVGTKTLKPNEWTIYSVTWTIEQKHLDILQTRFSRAETNYYNESDYTFGEGNYIYFAGMKLERGNVATDWTPAPEDEIKTVSTEYYLSTSATSLSGGSWSTTAPTWVNGKYMWMRTVVTNGYGDKTYTPSENGVCIAGAKGDKGDKGDKGEKGDAGTTTWAGITDKPTSFTPSAHNHNDRYYTESEIDTKLEGKANATHNHDDRYYTEAEITKSVTTDQLIAGKVLPRGEASDIGNSLQAFKNGYIETLDTTTVNAGSIQPKTASANIGSPNQKFDNVYAKTLNADNFSFASKVASQKSLAYYSPAGGSAVYVKAITVTVKREYVNSCITWAVTQRGHASYYIDLFLENRDDFLAEINYLSIRQKFQQNSSFIYAVTSGSTVDIYIRKSEPWDNFSIDSCEIPNQMEDGVTITYPDNEYVTSLPSGAVQAKCPAYITESGLYGAVFN